MIARMLEQGDRRIIERDVFGNYRFNAELTNGDKLAVRMDQLASEYGEALDSARQRLQALYEQVFDHKSFTGRSGGMFAFEGLGSIYWHMVSKLLLAVQEIFYTARQQGADVATCQQLGQYYYRVREGIGFNKTPSQYGAFPTDPYSHTPKHLGAQQPGMTGQVKEEILTRFGELGLRVRGGAIHVEPDLLRPREFSKEPGTFRYLDVERQWRELTIPAGGLAFTWCQVPVVYTLNDSEDTRLTVHWDSDTVDKMNSLSIRPELACEIFQRTGRIRKIALALKKNLLFTEAEAL